MTAVTIPIPGRFVNGGGGEEPLLIMRDYVAPANVFGRNAPSNELEVGGGGASSWLGHHVRLVIDFNETISMQMKNL